MHQLQAALLHSAMKVSEGEFKERNGDKEQMKEWRVIGEDCIGRDFREGWREAEKGGGERETQR